MMFPFPNFPPTTHPNLYSLLNILLWFLSVSLLNSSWSISKVSFLSILLESQKLLKVNYFLIKILICQRFPPTYLLWLPLIAFCWLFLISFLLIVEFSSSLFFSYSFLDNIIHPMVLNTTFSVANILVLPAFPLLKKLDIWLVKLEIEGSPLYSFLSLILHIKSISKCYVFNPQNTSWSTHSPSPLASLYSQRHSYR